MYASISTPHLLLINQQVPLSSIGFLPLSLASHHDRKCTTPSCCERLPFSSWLCHFTMPTCPLEENMHVPSHSLKHSDFLRCEIEIILPAISHNHHTNLLFAMSVTSHPLTTVACSNTFLSANIARPCWAPCASMILVTMMIPITMFSWMLMIL